MADKVNPGRLGLASVSLQAGLAAALRMWISPFKGSRGAPTYFKDVAYAATRVQLNKLTLEQSAYLNPSTEEAYLAACKAANFAPDSILFEDGVKAHWIGKRSAEKLIIYFHGGGYCVPATGGLYAYLFDLNEALNAAGHDTSILLLGYTLAPVKTYPTQLKQAVELVKYVVELNQWSPSNITFAGDSAGGNLALGVFSHILHPHPQIEPLEVSGPFNAAVLISPWVSFDNKIPSMSENAERDMFDAPTVAKWSSAFLGGAAGDNYSEPLVAPPSWWDGLEKIVPELLIWAGEWEILLDGIKQFTGKLHASYRGNLKIAYGPKAAHEEMIIDKILGAKEKSESTLQVENYIKAKL